ncbi:Coiled-coil domain-containing protein [Intoshia linei]|uniref:Coiled-coil domain-containing protein n=1 Tax=Intoshia linei TaxID=1819745 RepID=A0A177B8I1_9BILA|nr:Coiled-coil domain-containing protein [Intoshia linei]
MSNTKLSVLVQKCEELKKKMVLMEGDRKAFYENSEWEQKKNKDTISKLRMKYKEIYHNRADKMKADAELISNSLADAPEEKKCFKNKPGLIALDLINNKHKDYVNQLNYLRYTTENYKKTLSATETKYDEMVKDVSESKATDQGESDVAKETRNLENKLEKSKLKCREAIHIHQTYDSIKYTMLQECQTFSQKLDMVESEIQLSNAEHENQKKINEQATLSRDTSRVILEKQEKEIYASRKKREVDLSNVRKQAEEKRLQYDRRMAATSLKDEEGSNIEKYEKMNETDQNKITTYEQATIKIKEATGVTDTQEVVIRFENQGETEKRLQSMKEDNEKLLIRQQEEYDELKQNFENMKYTGENKISDGERVLEEKFDELKSIENTLQLNNKNLNNSTTLLLAVKSGINHLTDKLKQLKTTSTELQKVKIPPESDEYILDQLSICEDKMIKLLEDMNGEDIDTVWNMMTENEYISIVDTKQPQYNTHVKIGEGHKETAFDEEDSGDDQEVLTRLIIKKQSQNILETKNKRKVGGRKKEKK